MASVSDEKIEIKRALKAIVAAENRKDVRGILENLTDDAIMQKSGAPQIRGLDAWSEDYRRFFEGFISTSIESMGIEVSSSCDMAWGYGVYVSHFEGPSAPVKTTGKYLSVWKKVDGNWKAVAVSITEDG